MKPSVLKAEGFLASGRKSMLWFKHAHDLRNSPAMKFIQRELSDEGFAAAIRLIEVLTYRCGTGTRFNPVLIKPTCWH